MQEMQVRTPGQEDPLEKEMALCLELPYETGLILRCARKVGNPLQTEKGSRPSCRNQERRRGSDEVVPGTQLDEGPETP